jgi:hypothetical protein
MSFSSCRVISACSRASPPKTRGPSHPRQLCLDQRASGDLERWQGRRLCRSSWSTDRGVSREREGVEGKDGSRFAWDTKAAAEFRLSHIRCSPKSQAIARAAIEPDFIKTWFWSATIR